MNVLYELKIRWILIKSETDNFLPINLNAAKQILPLALHASCHRPVFKNNAKMLFMPAAYQLVRNQLYKRSLFCSLEESSPVLR